MVSEVLVVVVVIFSCIGEVHAVVPWGLMVRTWSLQ